MNKSAYEIAEYIIKNNPKAITKLLIKYGINPTKTVATPSLILQIIEQNGQLALMDLFEAYWSIINNRVAISYDGFDYAGSFLNNNAAANSSISIGPPPPPATEKEPEKKKNFWETFSNVFSAISGGVSATGGLINAIKQPKQAPVEQTPMANDTILGLSKTAFFGIVIIIVVVVIAVAVKAKK